MNAMIITLKRGRSSIREPGHNLPHRDFLRSQKNRLAAALIGWMVLGGAMAQSAMSLPDPTRPPLGFVDQLPTGGATARGLGAAEGSALSAPTDDADEARRGLQSVLIPRHGKPVAIIDGKYVPLGERHGDYELVAVSESEVVLVRGKERKVLKLTPKAAKNPVRVSGSGKEAVRVDGKRSKEAEKTLKAQRSAKSELRQQSETDR